MYAGKFLILAGSQIAGLCSAAIFKGVGRAVSGGDTGSNRTAVVRVGGDNVMMGSKVVTFNKGVGCSGFCSVLVSGLCSGAVVAAAVVSGASVGPVILLGTTLAFCLSVVGGGLHGQGMNRDKGILPGDADQSAIQGRSGVVCVSSPPLRGSWKRTLGATRGAGVGSTKGAGLGADSGVSVCVFLTVLGLEGLMSGKGTDAFRAGLTECSVVPSTSRAVASGK